MIAGNRRCTQVHAGHIRTCRDAREPALTRGKVSLLARFAIWLVYRGGVYYPSIVTIDKWIVLAVAIIAIIALNVNFIRRMNRRSRDDKKE